MQIHVIGLMLHEIHSVTVTYNSEVRYILEYHIRKEEIINCISMVLKVGQVS